MSEDFTEAKKMERIRLYSLRSAQKRSEPLEGKVSQSKKRSSKRKQSPRDLLERAKEHLMLSFVPAHIPCRDKERSEIYNYLRNSIQQKGNGSPLYISGLTRAPFPHRDARDREDGDSAGSDPRVARGAGLQRRPGRLRLA